MDKSVIRPSAILISANKGHRGVSIRTRTPASEPHGELPRWSSYLCTGPPPTALWRGTRDSPSTFLSPTGLSSRIEGTQATLGELLAAEAGAAVDRSPADLREVGNYVTALEYGLERLDTLPLSLRLVREMHERLMRGVRGDVATPGELQRTQNWIGPPGCTLDNATYVPPPPSERMACLGDWERFLHDDALPPLLHAALVLSQFEAVHPFLNGNGRVGRLLITLLLVNRGVLPSPLLYLSAYFEATREEYYARLLGVTERGEWEECLTYFLRGVVLQSEDAVDRIQRIDDLFSQWKQDLPRGQSPVPERALDLFAENPFWTVGGVADRLSVAFTTAQRAIDRLEAAGVVAQVGAGRRNRVHCAEAVLTGPAANRTGGRPHPGVRHERPTTKATAWPSSKIPSL